jgi:glutamyl-tRNA synthetase
MEDIDSPRIKPGAAQQALADLAWLGVDWDGDPLVQTERLGVYREALDRLKAAEHVYPCTCTRTDVDRAASAPHAEHEGPVYPGTCSARRAGDAVALGEAAYAWRLRIPEETPAFIDAMRGPVQLDLHQAGGDFVVWKSAGTPAYQLAVVVDDSVQGVTEVIRGDDLLLSTPRQLLLYQALNLPAPRFAHVPLVVGPDGRRLAKRHGDTRLSSLREAGVKPERLLGLLSWSCGWLDHIESVNAAELLPRFRMESIPKEPFVLTPALLESIGYG